MMMMHPSLPSRGIIINEVIVTLAGGRDLTRRIPKTIGTMASGCLLGYGIDRYIGLGQLYFAKFQG